MRNKRLPIIDDHKVHLPMPSPQLVYALLRQLVYVAGVRAEAITVYDASRYIGDPMYEKIKTAPDTDLWNVRFAVRSNLARNARLPAQYDPTTPVVFADATVQDGFPAYPPRCVTEARYVVNMALLSVHGIFGVTLCAKNNFGSLYFPTTDEWIPAPLHDYGRKTNPMGTYHCLVDLCGHKDLGGKTLLYMIDGLYCALNQNTEVVRFMSFGDGWCSSLFVSPDPVAIDSVALDFLASEPRATNVVGRGLDNYLHEAALAENPPSGVVYDPDGDGVPLESLGVHEHWNNPVGKQYSRNLGMGEGVELVRAEQAEIGPDFTRDGRMDFADWARFSRAWCGPVRGHGE